MTVHVLEDLHEHEHVEAAAAAAVACDLQQQQQQQQLQVVPHQMTSRPAAAAAADEDSLAFLEGLPLYGQQDHAQMAAALLDGSNSSSKQQRRLQLLDTLQLSLRAVYLMLVFAPFLLLGVPMLLLSWYLLTRAAAAQQQGSTDQQQQRSGAKQLANSSSSNEGCDVTVISPVPLDSSSSGACHDASSSTSWLSGIAVSLTAAKNALSQPRVLLAALLRQLLSLLTQIAALLDLLLVLLLGGHWAAGIGAWESAGLWLRRHAWRLLLFSSSAAGAAFIKWGQWSSARRDIFPEDFCDTLASLHDK
jgi:hypothetical protein